MSAKVKNVTFSLPFDVIDKFKAYAEEKYIPSVNSGVKEALEQYIVKIEKEKLKHEMLKAAADPLFMKDLHDCMKAFETADSDTSGMVSEW